ncbi:MAG TPA: nucleoside triphosphate pyrophosphohydrolase [Firmicutes bacterium]|nr:nucleoside triphosphate pyrophosphohydrolase [Bacillota bacterium]
MAENSIIIVGLGPGAFEQLSLAAWTALRQADALYLRTAVHPTVAALEKHGISYQSFDGLYEQAETFAPLYQEIARQIIAAAAKGSVTYAVPGHPLVGETTVQLILKEAATAGIAVSIIPSMSALDAIYGAIRIDPGEGLQILDALDFQPLAYLPGRPALFLQVHNQYTASQLKLALLEILDPELEVTLVRAAGVPGKEQVTSTPLYQIDMHLSIDHLTSLYVPASTPIAGQARRSAYPLDALVKVLAQLRGENGCPWDRRQTHDSLKRYLIEETYEVIDAIEAADWDAVCEELGDVLLQIVFHAQLAAERDEFDMTDVVDAVTTKMIRRHPHVFADVQADDVATVLTNWELIKQAEQAEQGKARPKSLMDGVPSHMPALMQADQIQRKAAKVGFEWPDVTGALEKVAEELAELQAAINAADAQECYTECGDVLFALVNVARYMDIDPEDALRATIAKFKERFRHIEARVQETGRNLMDMTVEQMDVYWDEAKELEKNKEH